MKPFPALGLVVDLETAPIEDAADYLIDPIEAPSNYRDPDKIAQYISDKQQERLKEAALDPSLNRIVALGWRLEGQMAPRVFLCKSEDEERVMLRHFWQEVALEGNRTRRLIGFRILGFDLPTLKLRSVYLDVWPSRYLNTDRYRSPHLDLYNVLTENGQIRGHSLKFYASRFKIPVEAPDIEGANIPYLVSQGKWELIEDHCRSDVNVEYELATRLRYIEYDEDEDQDRQVG